MDATLELPPTNEGCEDVVRARCGASFPTVDRTPEQPMTSYSNPRALIASASDQAPGNGGNRTGDRRGLHRDLRGSSGSMTRHSRSIISYRLIGSLNRLTGASKGLCMRCLAPTAVDF